LPVFQSGAPAISFLYGWNSSRNGRFVFIAERFFEDLPFYFFYIEIIDTFANWIEGVEATFAPISD